MMISLTRVETEMLKVLQQKDKRYRQGIVQKIREDLRSDYESLKK
jgi:hypothetical protein